MLGGYGQHEANLLRPGDSRPVSLLRGLYESVSWDRSSRKYLDIYRLLRRSQRVAGHIICVHVCGDRYVLREVCQERLVKILMSELRWCFVYVVGGATEVMFLQSNQRDTLSLSKT